MENFLDLQQLISLSSLQSFANDKVILFYNASNIRDLEAKGDTTKLNTVYDFYKNLMPDALYTEFFNSSFGGITYSDEYTAQDFAEDYFPRPALSVDSDHYVYACVFKNGVMIWENTDPPTS